MPCLSCLCAQSCASRAARRTAACIRRRSRSCRPRRRRAFALRIQPLLTPEEAAVYRRGRNAHPHGIPKHATPGEYARATGLEALFGALYLSGQTARIEALFAAMMEEDHAI